MKNIKKAFTVIELIVVIAIMAILALILTPSVIGYINNAKESVCNTNFRTIETEYLASSIINNKITLQEILNGYNSNQICSLCENIEVIISDDGTQNISCVSDNDIELNTKIITEEFISNINLCIGEKNNNSNRKFSKVCQLNYLGGQHHLDDTSIRNSFLEYYGGSWPQFDAEILDKINEKLTENSSIQFIKDYYMQPKFLSENSDGSIDYYFFLATDDKGNNQWKTNLIYNPKEDVYYIYDEVENYNSHKYKTLNIGPYYTKTNYEDFIDLLDNNEHIIKIDLN